MDEKVFTELLEQNKDIGLSQLEHTISNPMPVLNLTRYEYKLCKETFVKNAVPISEWGNIYGVCCKSLFASNVHDDKLPRYSLWVVFHLDKFKKIIVVGKDFTSITQIL